MSKNISTTHVASPQGMTLTRYFSGMTNQQLLVTEQQKVVDLAISNLTKFKSVGFVDDLENWSHELSRLYNKKNPFKNKNASPNDTMFADIKNNPKLISKIKLLCSVDIAIYDEAKKMFG
jgi:hypothetical protein